MHIRLPILLRAIIVGILVTIQAEHERWRSPTSSAIVTTLYHRESCLVIYRLVLYLYPRDILPAVLTPLMAVPYVSILVRLVGYIG